MSSEENVKLEDMFENIESIISQLSNPDLPIEEAFDKYETGMKLIKGCNEKIDAIEKKVQSVGDDGELNDF